MDTAYGVRTELPNTCSTRVLIGSNMRATNRTDSRSHTRSNGLEMEDPMSAAVAWDISAAPARMPARPGRPHLVAVPCGDAVGPLPVAPLRLTRGGRLAITLSVAGALLVALIAVSA